MHKQLIIFLLVLATSLTESKGQNLQSCLDSVITTGEAKDLNIITARLISNQPQKDFYLIGESHTYLANNDFQFALIMALHPGGVYNILSEQPHAVCFLFNEFLETGNDSLLQKIKPYATYNLLKKIRQFNLLKNAEKRVRYYGVDYLDTDFDFDNYLLSLKIIHSKRKGKEMPIDNIIAQLLLKQELTKKEITLTDNAIHTRLLSDSSNYKLHYGKYYYDLLLLSDNMIGRSPNRDTKIFSKFLVLYKFLLEIQKTKPKFLSFYGIGHLFNFGNLLNLDNASPVKQSVFRIAIQYIHCIGGWQEGFYRDDGLYDIERKSLRNFIVYCKAQQWKIGFMSDKKCLNLQKSKQPDVIAIFNDYGNRKMASWKFD